MKQYLYRLAFCCIAALTPYVALAQTYSVSGTLLDSKDNSSLIEVNVILTTGKDSTSKLGAVTDVSGVFSITNVPPGRYVLKAVYLGYKTITQNVNVTNNNVNVGTLKMNAGTNELKTVTIKTTQIRATQLGDTTQFNADAFKTHPDATAEDLVTKMPGVTSDNSGVKVNGETVQQVYVDGKPFFGTDPTLALKNLPSEVIDKIQVFDKLSDQAQFTGFDDGNSQKTINIITKKNKSNGEFGKVYGAYGTDGRYIAGESLNYFDGDTRLSLIGLSNNINQQNFSSQDILGISGGGGGNRGGSGGRGGSSSNNFLVGQQGGITNTNSVGLNYSDNWGKKIKVTGSYFFNSTDNTTNTQLNRDYFSNSDTALTYGETDYAKTTNLNHRVNFRFEYTIDSFNSLIITPNISFQNNSASTTQADTTTSSNLKGDTTFSKVAANNFNSSNYSGYSFANNILFQHKFHKPRRTISVNLSTSINEKSGSGSTISTSGLLDSILTSSLNDNYTLYNNAASYSASINYTEPLGKKGQLQFVYNPSYTKSKADQETYTLDPLTQQYTDHDTLLSNKYTNTYTTQKAGVSYRIGDRKLNFAIGFNVQSATLQGQQVFPYDSATNPKPFESILPNAFFNYRFADGRNLRIMYRTSTTAPSVSQLQNVINITNPLLLTTGNPNLRQDFEQTLIVRYGLTKVKNARTFLLYLYAQNINNYVANSTSQYNANTTLSDGITINKGSQLTLPVNLNGYWSDKAFLTYGIPADFIKSNINLNGGASYTRNPGLINGQESFSNNYAPTAGVVISSNVSENLDFTFSYTGNYNFVNNTLQSQATNNYYSHTLAAKINWIFFKGVVLNTNIAESYYSTLTNTSGNENYILWTSYLGYKFLKSKALEARVTAYDMLNQNKSISRTVTDTYIENSTTQVLKQYFLFTLTYTIRNFKGALPDQNKNRPSDGSGHFHGDGPPPGGMPGSPGGAPGGGGPGGGGPPPGGGGFGN
jgi:hypothetical protein